jgi:subtilase family serine protease
MRSIKAFPFGLLAGALLGSTALLCSSGLMAQSFTPVRRIVNKIDESQLVTLKGNTHPSANAKNDRGRVSPDLPMTDLILVLSRDPAQQAAFEQFVASQYDSSSPNFHQWLTPQQVGENFGPSETDIATISNWLTGHGFTVDEAPSDHMSIRFSGKSSQVESAFHTEMHNLEVKGVAHIGNMSDPQIPAALAPAVTGVKALHNFFPRPLHHMGSAVSRDAATGKWQRIPSAAATDSETSDAARSQFAINVPASGGYDAYLVEDVAPYDFATIYNVLPLWNAGTDGTGQTIAIAGTSAINLSDVTTFRSTFGLPAYTPANAPTNISGNSQPLTMCTTTSSTAICSEDDLIENSLDVQWAGSVAKGASIILVSSYPASLSDDNLYDSESYIVHSSPLIAKVMNVSYGECELGQGTAGNVEYYNLWNSAYAEGIAVFVAAGDSGSASCDDGGDVNGVPYAAHYGLSVSGLASTPYNTSVGGTDFNWCSLVTQFNGGVCAAAPYWASKNTSNGSSALGYVPEVPWNDTCASPVALPFLEDVANSLGVSGVDDTESACSFVSNNYRELRHAGYSGLSYIVDTVGGSGGASGCVVNSTNPSGSTFGTCTTTTGAGTTGAANGSIPTYNNGWPKPIWQTGVPGIPQDGVRDIPDVSFFASAGYLSSSAYLICVSAITPCVYSTSVVPIYLEVGGTSVATPAMAGVMALINQKTGKSQGNPNQQLYELAAKQSYSSCSAETATTGNGCYFNDIDAGPNTTPYNNAVPCMLNTPNCTVLYSGDVIGILSGYNAGTGYDLTTGLGSLNVANVVNNWPGAIGSTPATVKVTPTPSSLTSNLPLSVLVTVSGASGTPSGSVTLAGGGYTSASETLNGSGSYTFNIPGGSLSAGTPDLLTASYSGSSTYAQASGTADVTVTKLTPTVNAVPSLTTFNSNQQITVAVTVAGGAGNPTPTGTVTLTGGGYTSATETLNSSGGYTFTIPYNVLAGGTYPLTILYSGDPTYNSTSGSASVTVTYFQPLKPTVTVTPAQSTLDTSQSLSVIVTVTGSAGNPAPTGQVTLSGGGYSLTTQTLVAVAGIPTVTFNIPGNTLSAGPQTLASGYSGDINYASGNNIAAVTVTQSAFTIAAAAAPAIATPGGQSTSAITVSTITNYAGTITLSCVLTSPLGESYAPSCSVNPSTVALSSGTTSGAATATVYTTAATSALAYPKLPGKGRGWEGAGGGAVLAFLLFLGIPARRRGWRSMLGILVVMAALGSLSACGGSSSTTTTTGTTPDTYTFMVTATGNPPVAPAPTLTFSVVVN